MGWVETRWWLKLALVRGALWAAGGVALACGSGHEPPGQESYGPTPNASPDAARDPSACLVTADRDGDGVVRTLDECADASAPALFDEAEDCDDADPTRQKWYEGYADVDGDGYPARNLASDGVCLSYGAGLAATALDCDDADPTRQASNHVDADGDGDGDPESERFCVGAEEPGYASRAGDCDDSDPAIHTDAEGELPLDGIDTDCDGHDFPVFGDWAPEWQRESALTLPEASRCNGAALSLVGVEELTYCYGAFRLYVGNRGSTVVEAGRLQVADLWQAHSEDVSLPPLAPGEVWLSHVFQWGDGSEFTLSTGADPGDCTPMDETGEFWVDSISCG